MTYIGFINDILEYRRIYINNEPTRYLICNKGYMLFNDYQKHNLKEIFK